MALSPSGPVPENLSPDRLALYLHVPFCSQKCDYCGFYSVQDGGRQKAYLDRLLLEAKERLGSLSPKNVETLYIGGGTPTLIRPALWEDFFSRLKELIPGPPVEWTVEANPESLLPEHLEVFQAAGVNRLSLGIQSFVSKRLAFLGRRAGPDDIFRALDLVEKKWKGRWSADLMAEIPGQSFAELKNDLQLLLARRPEHVSLYILTPEDGTPLFENIRSGKITDEPDDKLWEAAGKILEEAGWKRYEVSNFALPGGESRHNLFYWQMRPFLGLGPSAASTLPGRRGPIRMTNPADLERYLAFEDWPETEELSFGDFLMEFLLMGFRLRRGLEQARLERIFGGGLEDFLPGWTERHAAGRLKLSGGSWSLTLEGLFFMDSLLLEAREELEKRPELFLPDSSQKISWP